jgi:hypothetical protein
MKKMMKMKTMNIEQTIKRMVLTGAAVTLMMSLAAPAVVAQPVVRDQRDGSGEEAAPIVRDHRVDSTTSTVEPEQEKPYKDPGIRLCDITPVECEDAQNQEEQEEPYEENPDDTSQCFIKPYCEAPEESGDSGVVRDHRDGGKDKEAASAPGGVQVDVNNPSGAAPKDEEAASAPGGVKVEEAANSGTVYGCAYDDYYYDEETDMCWPNGMFLGVLFGDEPWPESAGGYVSLLGDFVQDPLVGLGVSLQAGLGLVGDALVEFGDTGNFVGWPFQGLGYTLGFLGDASGALGTGLGEAAGAVADGVGEVVDAIGDAAGAAYDEIASWF